MCYCGSERQETCFNSALVLTQQILAYVFVSSIGNYKECSDGFV